MSCFFKNVLLALFLIVPATMCGQVKEWFGATPDLHVSGKEFVDPEGRPVTLHGVMDTPNDYFNGGRWNDGTLGWPVYNNTRSVQLCRDYFTKVFQAIANPAKGSYCNLFRLHLDPAWTNDPNKTATGSGSENDISRFSANRLRQYMDLLYVPIAKDALAHGLYVIMRPPGVFPEDVSVGDAYNQYLTTVWDIVSSNTWVKEHAGQVMLELGNEPVRMSGHLADYFQPIVNKIRDNGFTGILLLPGTSYQANYSDYNTKPIVDNNFGYAVHNYPGWYGGWDANQTEASFIATFEAQVPVDKKPIVITEVDWSPMKQGAGHWNEMHTQYTEGNFGTWGTGTTNAPAPNVNYRNTQNVGWGMRFRHLVDKHPNISWTLQGTTTYVDMDAYLMDGTVQPAFTDQMKDAGYTDAREACSGSCFDWYYEYACGDRLPKGEVNVLPENPITPTYKTDATVTGNASFDKTNAHYCFYTPTYSSFTFSRFEGTKLAECVSLTISLGESSTIGYRLDMQLKDKDGNIIKDGANDFIIGTEAKGTRFTEPLTKTYDMQEIFGSYLTQYPGCTIGLIRLNTVVQNEDTNREGKYFFTLKEMKMEAGVISARQPVKVIIKSIKDIETVRDEEIRDYQCNNPENLGGWGNGATFSFAENAGRNGGGYILTNSQAVESYKAQFCIPCDLMKDKQYVLKLDVKGTTEGSIGAAIQNPDGYKDCGNFPAVPITTEWQTIKLRATVTDEGAQRVLLNFGAYVGTINLDNIQLYSEEGHNLTPTTDYDLTLAQDVTNGGVVYGTSTVAFNIYADLTAYSKMIIHGTGGTLRVMFNRLENEGPLTEKNLSLTDGMAEINLQDLDVNGFAHLHAIKAGWGQTVNVTSITLQTDGNPNEVADYYIEGKGVMSTIVNEAFADESATVIDITGYTGTTEFGLTPANPNCLLIYKEGANVGNVYGNRNMVKSTNNSSFKIDLVDGYDFRAPMAISTYQRASYTRDLDGKSWATMTLPFTLDVAAQGSPEIYQFAGVTDNVVNVSRVTSATLPAGTTILYRQLTGGVATLSGKDIAKTAEGLNIQPIAGADGWFTAQSFTHRVIDDVKADPELQAYDVYAICDNTFVHATKKLTLLPFRSIFLHKQSSQAGASLRIEILGEETNSIETLERSVDAADAIRYDASGRRMNAAQPGLNLIRHSDGTVERVFIR